MRIRTVVISIFLLITSLFVIQAMYSVTAGQDFIQESVGQSSLLLAQDMAKFIEFGISIRIDNLFDYSKTSIVQKAVLKSNQEFGEFEDIQGYITQQDDDWQSVPKETISPFMQSLISNELSEDIRKNYVEKIIPSPSAITIIMAEKIIIFSCNARIPDIIPKSPILCLITKIQPCSPIT